MNSKDNYKSIGCQSFNKDIKAEVVINPEIPNNDNIYGSFTKEYDDKEEQTSSTSSVYNFKRSSSWTHITRPQRISRLKQYLDKKWPPSSISQANIVVVMSK